MSSSDGAGRSTGTEPRLVRTAGLRPARTEGVGTEDDGDGAAARTEADRLRERVAELEDELESTRRERDDAREWAAFLDRELREQRERVETLEGRIEALESRGLFDRIRRLLG